MRAEGKRGKNFGIYRGHKSAGDSTPTLEAAPARARARERKIDCIENTMEWYLKAAEFFRIAAPLRRIL